MGIKGFFKCKVFKNHSWTCAAEEGIKPTPDQLEGVEGFFDYAKMYCKDCGKVSELSKRRMT